MPNPVFDFFEVVAEELLVNATLVLTETNLQFTNEQVVLLDELRDELNVSTNTEAINQAVEFLKNHFATKGSKLPFKYEPRTGRFTILDKDYLSFVKDSKDRRSLTLKAHEFEASVMERFADRATGSLHHVGWPRKIHTTRKAFNNYLEDLGFNGNVATGHAKDGGFDILWELPIGSIPHKPLVCLQCKNAEFNFDEGNKSVGASRSSLGQHRGLLESLHVQCVLFNDYIDEEHIQKLKNRKFPFVPLGLSDLSKIKRTAVTTSL